MLYGVIYLITNKCTGEQYIGQTRKKAAQRFSSHISMAYSPTTKKYKLAKAIVQYGAGAFDMQELYCAFDSGALNQAEICLIADYKPAYNIAKGGAGHRGVKPSAEVCKARSERLKRQWKNPEWRAKQCEKIKALAKTPEASLRGKQVAAIGIKARWANHVKKVKVPVDRSALTKLQWENSAIREARIAGLKNKFNTPESREKRRQVSLGRVLSTEAKEKIAKAKFKPIYCPELQISFLSQKYAAEYLNALPTSVANAIKSKGKVNRNYTLVRVA